MDVNNVTVSIYDCSLVDLQDFNFWPWAFIAILAGPLTWNIIARFEYKTRFLSNLFGGNRLVANYVLAFYILGVGFYRDYAFGVAIASQPKLAELSSDFFYYLGAACIGFGQLFVLTSFYKLGFLGTFLADYFGFLKDAPCSGFPFTQYMSNPMYMGATLSFGGSAIMAASPAGLVLTLWVYIVYRFALALEETFTNYIYAERERLRQKGKKKK